MKTSIISLTETATGKFDMVLQIGETTEKLAIVILAGDSIFGVQGSDFEALLLTLPSGKERQDLITALKQKYHALRQLPELQAA